jgi:hypothetical protein
MMKKFKVAENVIHPRLRQEITRAGVALLPMFFSSRWRWVFS